MSAVVQLRIVGYGIGHLRGDGEPTAEERLAALQKAVEAVTGDALLKDWSSMRALDEALKASRQDEESSAGPSDVIWTLFIDVHDGLAFLRTRDTPSHLDAERIELNKTNTAVGEGVPDKVPIIDISVV